MLRNTNGLCSDVALKVDLCIERYFVTLRLQARKIDRVGICSDVVESPCGDATSCVHTSAGPPTTRGGACLVAPLLGPHFPALIDDFYAEIQRHPDVRSVITGGVEQIERLKGSILSWVRELLRAVPDTT